MDTLKLLTVKEVAALVRADPDTVRRWASVHDPRLPVPIKLGRRLLFERDAVLARLQPQKVA